MAFRLASLFPDPGYPAPQPFRQNRLLKMYLAVLVFFWLYTGATATDFINWMLENSLTIPAVYLLIFFYPKLPFSNTSYTLILLFLLLHLYGSQNAYAKNPFGFWLMEQFSASRNHYDRIVHFCFGFLLVYPMQEVLYKVSGQRNWLLYFIPVALVLLLSAFYEIVEWLVADVFFPDLGMQFIGAQGDIWDSQKDMFLATLGGFIMILYVLLCRKLSNSKR
ncbi:DUF2238 domain-containing protein [Adhaeribacter sp. BT258]|uniref:DUF2238 domain-containing protein n=1 Tax=Adhaeribacter terrigena TaxID=2793070 RepID=A0ABS1C6A8_9BACT|nr:DUF2238 domain-containing protein [Adhaeribacter terrigena]MBK0404843.1 DUF2238 domain-containing protein [Adhaeribacter terrigena]